jgi:DnaJ-class molecular chaperone
VILKLALGRRIEFADPGLNEAGTVAALKNAAALYVRHVFFRPDATPYQILGLRPGASAPAIKERFRLLMHLVHPDRQDADNAWPESLAALANRAVSDQEARAAYAATLMHAALARRESGGSGRRAR